MSGTVKGIIVEIGGDTSGLQKALSKINSASSGLSKELRGINSLLKLDPKNTVLVSQKQKVLAENIATTEEKLKSLREAQRQADRIMAEGGEITQENYRALQREIIATQNKLSALKVEASSWDKAADALIKYGERITAISQKIEDLGRNLTTKITLPLVAVAGGMTKTTADFESSMKQVAATMGITVKEIEDGSESYKILEEAAKECGEKTKYSASEAAEALNYMALAGYDAKQSAETLPKVLNLAAAGNLDLAAASDMVTDAMAALGMQTSDLDKYIDEMAKTSQKSNTSVAQLGEATLTCAGTVKMSGMSLETMNTELGILANNGIKGAEGGTHLRNIILSLTSPTDVAAKALKNLGIKVTDSSGNIRDMNDIMADFNKKLDGMSDEKKTNVISQIFNKTDISAVNALIKGSGEEFTNLKGQISNCNGAAQNMADTMNSSLKGQITLLKSQVEGISIKMGNKLMPTIKKTVKQISGLADKFSKLSDKQVETIINIAGFVAAIGPAMTIIGKLGTKLGSGITTLGNFSEAIANVRSGVKTAEGQVGTFTKILGAMASPAGGVILGTIAVAGVTTGIYELLKATGLQIDKDNIYYESTEKLIKKHQELTEELNNNIKARDEVISSAESECATADILFSKIEELAGVENKTNTQKEIMKGLVADLNEIMPDLNLQYDEEHDKLSDSTQAIRDNIEAQKDLLKAKAAQELLSPILADIAKAEIEHTELVKQKEQNEKEYQDAFQNRKNIMLDIQEQGGKMTKEQREELKKAQELEETLKTAYDESKKALNENETALKSLNQEYETTSKYAENLFNQAEIERKLAELTSIAEKKGVAIPDSVRKGVEKGKYAVPQSIEELQRLINFDNALQNAKITGVTIPEEMKQGIINGSVNVTDAVAQLGQEMNRINKQEADKMPEEIKNTMLNVASNINNDKTVEEATSNKMLNVTELWDNNNKIPIKTDEKMKATAGNIKNYKGVETAAADKATEVTTNFDNNNHISEKMQEEVIETSNVLNTDGTVKAGSERVANEANTGFNNKVDGHKWGSDLTENISSGIISKIASVATAAARVAGTIASYLHHSVPDKGPLADEMSYMPDMIENLTKTLIKASPKLEKASFNIAEKMASNLDLSKYQATLNSKVIDSTKTIFTTPQIVFNVQELDEAKLKQCFNYINKKFGSKY